MTNEPLYKIEEQHPTTGEWALIHEDAKKMTKEKCSDYYENLLRNEVNPNYLRIVRVQ